MRDQPHIEYRGYHGGHLLLAVLGGAAAGAVVAFLTAPRSGAESRDRLRAIADDTRNTAGRLPLAMRKATEAAREAFNEALDGASG